MDAGASVDSEYWNGNSLLHAAVDSSDYPMVVFLLEHSSRDSLLRANRLGVTPFHIAWSQMPVSYMATTFDIEKALSRELSSWDFSSVKSDEDDLFVVPMQFEIVD